MAAAAESAVKRSRGGGGGGGGGAPPLLPLTTTAETPPPPVAAERTIGGRGTFAAAGVDTMTVVKRETGGVVPGSAGEAAVAVPERMRSADGRLREYLRNAHFFASEATAQLALTGIARYGVVRAFHIGARPARDVRGAGGRGTRVTYSLQAMGGSMFDIISGEIADVTPRERMAIAHGALKALADLRASGAAHRDIKPANILVRRLPGVDADGAARWQVALTDWDKSGVQAYVGAPAPLQVVYSSTIGYRTPGTLTRVAPAGPYGGERATEQDDAWALACSLWELFFAGRPASSTSSGMLMFWYIDARRNDVDVLIDSSGTNPGNASRDTGMYRRFLATSMRQRFVRSFDVAGGVTVSRLWALRGGAADYTEGQLARIRALFTGVFDAIDPPGAALFGQPVGVKPLSAALMLRAFEPAVPLVVAPGAAWLPRPFAWTDGVNALARVRVAQPGAGPGALARLRAAYAEMMQYPRGSGGFVQHLFRAEAQRAIENATAAEKQQQQQQLALQQQPPVVPTLPVWRFLTLASALSHALSLLAEYVVHNDASSAWPPLPPDADVLHYALYTAALFAMPSAMAPFTSAEDADEPIVLLYYAVSSQLGLLPPLPDATVHRGDLLSAAWLAHGVRRLAQDPAHVEKRHGPVARRLLNRAGAWFRYNVLAPHTLTLVTHAMDGNATGRPVTAHALSDADVRRVYTPANLRVIAHLLGPDGLEDALHLHGVADSVPLHTVEYARVLTDQLRFATDAIYGRLQWQQRAAVQATAAPLMFDSSSA